MIDGWLNVDSAGFIKIKPESESWGEENQRAVSEGLLERGLWEGRNGKRNVLISFQENQIKIGELTQTIIK